MTGAYRIKPEEMEAWIEASAENPGGRGHPVSGRRRAPAPSDASAAPRRAAADLV